MRPRWGQSQQAYAEVISQRRDTDSSFYLWDGISNIRQLTDELEVVTDEYSFAAFGTLRSSTGSTANSQQYKGRLIAYRKDPNAGPETEYSLHHRNYNPTTGVFKSQDPAKDDLNLYRYVKNNPVNRTDPSGLLDDNLNGERSRFAMYERTTEKLQPLICERDQKIRELQKQFKSRFKTLDDYRKFLAGIQKGFYEDGLKGDIEFVGLCVQIGARYSNPVHVFNDVWGGLRKLVGAWEAAEGAAEAVAPYLVALKQSDGDFEKFLDSLSPSQQEVIFSLAPLLLEIQIGLIELLGETADPEFIGRIYGMILYELLVDAAIAGAVAATGGTGSGGAGAAYGIRAINFARKLEDLGTFGKQAANLVDRLKPQIEQTLKLISEGGGGRKKFKDCRGDIRSPNQRVGSGNGGSLKNKMGELDEAARRARTDPVHGRPDVPETKVNAPTGRLVPGSAEHKAARWSEYQQRGGRWSYERWSKTYERNISRAKRAHAAVAAYHALLGWGKREVTVIADGVARRLDVVDVARRRGVEYKTGYSYRSQEVLWELERDANLVKKGWQIEWVFEGTASQPLLDALREAGIAYSFR